MYIQLQKFYTADIDLSTTGPNEGKLNSLNFYIRLSYAVKNYANLRDFHSPPWWITIS